MRRRDCLRLLSAAMLAAGTASPLAAQTVPGRALWEAWKARFLDPSGRVIDFLQQEASHTEGQGYGMVLASHFDDQDALRRMLGWADANLGLRGDRLYAWRWLPHGEARVPDRNNASDGDLFIAWAMVRAARRWGDSALLDRAAGIAEDLVAQCIVQSPEDPARVLFLPASFGFVHDRRVVVNPSYYMPRAMREVAAATGQDRLAAAAADGEALMARIAADGLVPDWVELTREGWRAAETMSVNAGYEAIRVPLFLTWSGRPDHPAVQQVARAWRAGMQPSGPVPVVMERVSGLVLEESPDPGYRAVAALISCAGAPTRGAAIPPFTAEQHYYPATLQLFTVLAATETLQGCLPI